MAKGKQRDTNGPSEKKLRKRLQRAEQALISAEQRLEQAQASMSKAVARVERRKAALADARGALAAHVGAPAGEHEAVAGASGDDATRDTAAAMSETAMEEATGRPSPDSSRQTAGVDAAPDGGAARDIETGPPGMLGTVIP